MLHIAKVCCEKLPGDQCICYERLHNMPVFFSKLCQTNYYLYTQPLPKNSLKTRPLEIGNYAAKTIKLL